jgi:hypothetical protein
MSDACTIYVLWEHNRYLIDNSRCVIDESRVMIQLVAYCNFNYLSQKV